MENVKKWFSKPKYIVFAVLLVALLGIGSTIAMFTDTEKAVNTINIGKGEIVVDEDPVGFSKENVGITNTGDVPVYVRMRVDAPQDISYFDKNGNKKTLITLFNPESPADWEYNAVDGYYYYHGGSPEGVVNAGERKQLFTSVVLADKETGTEAKLTKEDIASIGHLLDITVYGECVQSDNLQIDPKTPENAFAEVK